MTALLITDDEVQRWRTLLHIRCGHTLRVHSSNGSTFLREMTSWAIHG